MKKIYNIYAEGCFFMNSNIILKQRLTALTLASTLLLSGCNTHGSSFELVENENNEIVAVDNTYISNDYLNKYYVVEVYNKVTKMNEIYIARSKSTNIRYRYFDAFTNFMILDEFNSDPLLELVKVSRLNDYVIALGLEQLEYSYEDMEKIYEIIKEIYIFEDNNSLRKTRKIDNRI